MTRIEAHAILNQLRNGKAMPVAVTNQALLVTGDITGFFDKSLRFDGNEQRFDRPCQTHDALAEVGFSYSAYLDCPKTEGVTQ